MYSADVKIQVIIRNQQIAICDVAYKVSVIGGKSATDGMGYAAYFVIRTQIRVDLLSIPQSWKKNVKTFRWDHRLQIRNLFMALKRVPLW